MPRLSNEQVMALSHEQLVRYCDWLLTEEGALDMLTYAFRPDTVPAVVARPAKSRRGPRKRIDS